MKKLLFFLCLGLVFGACRKDLDTDLVTTIDSNPPVIQIDVNGDLAGSVNDEEGNPIVGALVSFNGNSQETDENGLYLFKNISLNGAGTLVYVEKEGYFHTSRRFYPFDNRTNYLEFELLDQQEIGRISANAGGRFTTLEGMSLDFPTNSIVDAMGNLYDGEVKVLAHWIDPASTNLAEIMPGNLEAENEAGDAVSLVSYGMMAVELVGENGEELNLGNGQKAQLGFPLSGDHRAAAPAEIPLWYYDEISGLWEEEGVAQLDGDQYLGEVSHFSFWNCDAPFPLIVIEGQVLVADNGKGETVSMQKVKVQVKVADLNTASCGYTDDSGYFRGKVPAGVELELIFSLADDCNIPLLSIKVGPFNVDTDLGEIKLTDLINSNSVFVEGVLLDCDDNQLSEGWLKVEKPGRDNYYYIDNGLVNLFVTNCTGVNELTVTGIDRINRTEGDPITSPIVSNGVDLGFVSTCENVLMEFFTVNLNGEDKDLFPISVDIHSASQMYFKADNDNSFGLTIYNHSGVGMYDTDNVLTFAFQQEFQSFGVGTVGTGCSGLTIECVEFTEFVIDQYTPMAGEYIKGHFTGTMDAKDSAMNDFNDLPFTGQFSVPVTD